VRPSAASTLALLLCLTPLLALPASAASRRVRPGEWGAEHVTFSVSEEGAAVEFDCAHGRVDGPLQLDRRGRFEAEGRYVPERPGPVSRDASTEGRPARYRGDVRGRAMTLRVTVDDGTALGPYRLVLGQRGHVFKCR
jgi:hypothetical protein